MKQRPSSGKKKRVRLDLTHNEKTISPTNMRMKADLFCKHRVPRRDIAQFCPDPAPAIGTARAHAHMQLPHAHLADTRQDFAAFEFDAMYQAAAERQRKEAEEREREREREREAELRRRQAILWGDQQVLHSEALQNVLKRAAAAFSQAPSHKRARGPGYAPPAFAAAIEGLNHPLKPPAPSPHSTTPTEPSAAVSSPQLEAERNVLSRLTPPSVADAPATTPSDPQVRPIAATSADAAVAFRAGIPHRVSPASRGTSAWSASPAHSPAARSPAAVPSPAATPASPKVAPVATASPGAVVRALVPTPSALPAAVPIFTDPDSTLQPPTSSRAGAVLLRTEAPLYGGPMAPSRTPPSASPKKLPGTISLAPAGERTLAERSDHTSPRKSPRKSPSKPVIRKSPLADRSNLVGTRSGDLGSTLGSSRNERLASEIEGLTMAQLKEKIQEVTRRRRDRHKRALETLGVSA